VRWIDLGCPSIWITTPSAPNERGFGWMLDDTRPTLTMTYPKAGANPPLARILVGMHDYYTGLDMVQLQVVADFAPGRRGCRSKPGAEVQSKDHRCLGADAFQPLTELPKGKLTVSVKDRQGNLTRMERTFAVVSPP